MKRFILIMICCLGTVMMCYGQEQQAQKLLSKAIYEEEVNGNLDEAIKSYQVVLDQYSDNRKVAAEALFHLGMCYEKQGTRDAVNTYKRLVSNYPDQKSLVAQAKKRLNGLIAFTVKESNVPLTPKFTKINIPTKPGNGVLSPDGKKLAYISEKSIWILPVQGQSNPKIAGEPKRLTEPIDAWNLANMGIVWSANGQWLAFYGDQVYIISASGGEPIKVNLANLDLARRCGKAGYDYRMSLSPDGKMLAFVYCDENKNKAVYTLSVVSGTLTKLTGPLTREPAFSPDGKLIAYIQDNPVHHLGDEIRVIPVNGGETVLISDNNDVFKSPIWSPDGSMIAYLSRKYKKGWANASNELRIVSVNKKGESMDLSTKIDLNYTTSSMLAGWSHDNKIGIWLSTPEKNLIYTVPATGGQAMQVTPNNSWMPSWSADGHYLFFDGINTNDWAGLESIPVNGGNPSKIPIISEFELQPSMPTGGISVSPDGNKIVFAGHYGQINDSLIRQKLNGSHLMTVPVKGGKIFQLTTNRNGDRYPVWSPDGKSIAFLRVTDAKSETDEYDSMLNIYTIPEGGGIPEKITSTDAKVAAARIDWSPDGKWIGYYSLDNTIKVIPATGGKPKIVAKDVELNHHYGLSFSPEGDKIIYSTDNKLKRIDINGENETEVKTGLDGIPTMPAWSPDGKKIAFSVYNKGESDLWFLENFLPLEKLAQKKEKEDITIRKVIDGSGAGFVVGNPSPDGKYFAFVDWLSSPNDIVIKEIGTEKEIRLKNQTDLNFGRDTGTPYSPIWSSDSKKLVYTWHIDNDEHVELRVVEIDNPSPDVLVRVSLRERNGWVQAEDWSPDGQHILVGLIDNSPVQMGLISIEDGAFNLLKKFDGHEPTSAKFSPDGHYVAYDLPPSKENTNHDIYVLSINGKQETKLTSHPSHDYLLDWTPSGKEILFASDRTGTTDMWSTVFNEGTLQEKPKLITKNIGVIEPLGTTLNGSLYFSTPGSWWDIFTVTITPTTGEIAELATEVLLPYQGYNRHPKWSPDGKYLAYVSDLRELRRPNILCIYSKETGSSKEFAHQKDVNFFPCWFPDGKSILVNFTDVLNIATGEITPFIQLKNEEQVYSARISSDSKYIYYAVRDKYWKMHSIISRDLESGDEKELYRTTDANLTISLSPDGKQLALMSLQKEDIRILKILSTVDYSEKDIYTFKQKEFGYKNTAWSPDGKYIYFSKRTSSEEKRPDELWRIPVAGGIAENLGVSMHLFTDITIHPDGKHITFASFVGLEKPGRVWVMENFLPKEEAVNK